MGEKKVFWEIRDEEISDMFEEFKKTDNYSKLSDEQRSKLLEANKLMLKNLYQTVLIQ